MKQLLTFLLFLLSFSTFSQIQQAQWLIGGNAALSYSKATYLKETALHFAPDAGYFFINKLAGGLRPAFDMNTYEWNDKWRETNIAIAPFLRYYFLPAAQKINLFAEGSYGYTLSYYKGISFGDKESYRYSTYAFMAGPAIFLNEHTALEITAGYNHSGRGPSDTTATKLFQLGVGLQIHFGKHTK